MSSTYTLYVMVVTAGKLVCAYEPYQALIGYETGSWDNGCYCTKCANGYALFMTNWECAKGHCGSNTWASGYPVCPHGDTRMTSQYRYAHCHNDSGWNTLGYRAPCAKQFLKIMHFVLNNI